MQAMYGSVAYLPTQTNISTVDPQSNMYFESSDICYVLADAISGKVRRVIKSYGTKVSSGWEIGCTHNLHHDQAGYHLGTFRVVGWFTSDAQAGNVPARKLPLGVFK